MAAGELGVRAAAHLRVMLRALKYRNYQLFFFGQGVSVIGTWMQATAMGWLIYVLTGSAFLLGLVGFLSQVPAAVVAPIAGVLADRHNRRRILVVTQTFAMIQAFALTALVYTGTIQVWHIIALSAGLGIVNAFDVPTRQSFVVNMVEKREDLSNAIALNALIFNSGQFIGAALAAVILAVVSDPLEILSPFARVAAPLAAPAAPYLGVSLDNAGRQLARFKGEGLCFLLNGFSYMAVIVALLMMKLNWRAGTQPRRNVLHELREGAVYVFSHPAIRAVLLLISSLTLFTSTFRVLMPVFAKDILHGGADTQGALVSAVGAGALVGAVLLAARQSLRGIERLTVLAVTVLGVALIIFSQSKWLAVSLPALVIVGIASTSNMAACNTIVQTVVEDNKRGRLMSFWALSWMAVAPFGSLLAGYLADVLGAPMAVTISGTCAIVAAILFSKSLPRLRADLDAAQAERRIL